MPTARPAPRLCRASDPVRLLTLPTMLLCAAAALAAPKTDVVVLSNGDRITGEVKGLERGQLRFETDAAGTLSIEWARIATLTCAQVLQVELESGARFTGRSPKSGTAGRLRIEGTNGTAMSEFELAEIVRIAPIDQGSIIARLDGYVTAGYDYTKASEVQQFTFTGGLSNRDERREWNLDGATTSTTQADHEDSKRFDLSASDRRFLRNRRFYQGFLIFDGNDELGLDLRTTVGGAYGAYLVQDGRQEWTAFGGLALTREEFQSEDSQDGVEGVLGMQYSYFRFDAPEANLDASLTLLPSLTESGRVRSEAKLRSRYEIVTDLFFEVSLYGSYDTDPDEEADTKSDYGVTTSLGYSF